MAERHNLASDVEAGSSYTQTRTRRTCMHCLVTVTALESPAAMHSAINARDPCIAPITSTCFHVLALVFYLLQSLLRAAGAEQNALSPAMMQRGHRASSGRWASSCSFSCRSSRPRRIASAVAAPSSGAAQVLAAPPPQGGAVDEPCSSVQHSRAVLQVSLHVEEVRGRKDGAVGNVGAGAVGCRRRACLPTAVPRPPWHAASAACG